MSQENEIVNRVANSELVIFNLEDYYQAGERVFIDIKDQLFEGFVLKEKDFRDYIKSNNWSQYVNKYIAINCSTDAIVPTWAYMLLAIALQPYARLIHFGTLEELENRIFFKELEKIDWYQFENAKVVIKGCSKIDVPKPAYIEAVSQLQKVASSIMYGEPCSTVPLYKKRK
jgi:Protein of unknown function (DUF2480)